MEHKKQHDLRCRPISIFTPSVVDNNDGEAAGVGHQCDHN